MSIFEWKKYNIFGGVLVPTVSGDPQQRGFKILHKEHWAYDLQGAVVLLPLSKS